MQAFPQEVRDDFFDARDAGATVAEAVAEAKIGYSTGLAWDRQRLESQTRKTPSECAEKKPTELEAKKPVVVCQLTSTPEISLEELAQAMRKHGLNYCVSAYSRYLKKWGYAKVRGLWTVASRPPARPAKRKSRRTKLTPHLKRMAELALSGTTLEGIVEHLQQKYGVDCTTTAVHNRLQEMNVPLKGAWNRNSAAEADAPAAAAGDIAPAAAKPADDAPARAKPKRQIAEHTAAIVRWATKGKNPSIKKIVKYLWQKKKFRTSDATVCRLLNDEGIHLPKGRNPVGKTKTMVIRKGNKVVRTETAVAGRGEKRAWTVPQLRETGVGIAALAARLQSMVELTGFKDDRLNGSLRHFLIPVLIMLMIAVGARKTAPHRMAAYLHESEGDLGKVLELPYGVPSEAVLRRVLNLEPRGFAAVVLGATARIDNDTELPLSAGGDGKITRGVRNKADNCGQFTTFVNNCKQSLSMLPFGKGGKEIKAGLDAISSIGELYPNLRFILSHDALHTNMKTMQRMTKYGHDAILPVKNNRTKLWREAFKAVQGDYDQYCSSTEESHGRKETRTLRSHLPTESLLAYWKKKWKGKRNAPKIAQVILEENYRNGQKSVRLFILTTKLEIEVAAQLIRWHWLVENMVHNIADQSFREDWITSSKGNIAVNIGTLIRAWLNLAQRYRTDIPIGEKLLGTENNLLKNLAVIASDEAFECDINLKK